MHKKYYQEKDASSLRYTLSQMGSDPCIRLHQRTRYAIQDRIFPTFAIWQEPLPVRLMSVDQHHRLFDLQFPSDVLDREFIPPLREQTAPTKTIVRSHVKMPSAVTPLPVVNLTDNEPAANGNIGKLRPQLDRLSRQAHQGWSLAEQ